MSRQPISDPLAKSLRDQRYLDGEKVKHFPVQGFNGGTFSWGIPGQKPFMTGTVRVEEGKMILRDDALDQGDGSETK